GRDDAAKRHRPRDPGARRARRHRGHPARTHVSRGPLRPPLRRPGRGASDGRRSAVAVERSGRLPLGLTLSALTAADVAALLGGGEVRDLARMLGGASRETWSFSYDGRPLVLRRDPP